MLQVLQEKFKDAKKGNNEILVIDVNDFDGKEYKKRKY